LIFAKLVILDISIALNVFAVFFAVCAVFSIGDVADLVGVFEGVVSGDRLTLGCNRILVAAALLRRCFGFV
jgi:hypothetical protein